MSDPLLITREMTLRADPTAPRRAVAVVSTSTEDAHGTVVEQDWNLGRLATVGVPLLWAHDAKSLPLGRVARAAVVGGRLEATLEFADNRKANEVWAAVEAGTVRSVSAGFVPKRVRWEERGGRPVAVLSQNELIEVSCTSTPSNPDAVMMQLRALGARKDTTAMPTDRSPAAAARDFLARCDTPEKLHAFVAADPAAYERFTQLAAVGEAPRARPNERWADFTYAQLASIFVEDRARYDRLKATRETETWSDRLERVRRGLPDDAARARFDRTMRGGR